MEQPVTFLPRLWKPNQVFWIGFLFGWPGAIVLACMNWARIGKREKAMLHLAAALPVTLVYTIMIWSLPESSLLLPLFINVLILYYLKERLDRDMPSFRDGLYMSAGWLRGSLICIGILMIYLACIFSFVIALSGMGILPGPPPVDPGGFDGVGL
jgi:hypothetical protein